MYIHIRTYIYVYITHICIYGYAYKCITHTYQVVKEEDCEGEDKTARRMQDSMAYTALAALLCAIPVSNIHTNSKETSEQNQSDHTLITSFAKTDTANTHTAKAQTNTHSGERDRGPDEFATRVPVVHQPGQTYIKRETLVSYLKVFLCTFS